MRSLRSLRVPFFAVLPLGVLPLGVLPLGVLPLGAQSITTFGSGCGARGTQLAGYGSPTPGGTLELRVADAAPSAPHLLIVGFSDSRWAGGSLPWPVPPGLGFANGCALLVSNDIAVPFAVDADGSGSMVLPVPATVTAGTVYLQVLGVPSAEENYLTAGVAAALRSAPPVAVTGTARERQSGQPVPDARVTVFTPGLSVFHEVRSGAAGAYLASGVAPGRYRIGVAARGRDYVESDLDVGAGGALRSFLLDPESHPGSWDVVGDTLPHTLDATDIAVLLPDGRIFYCHDSEDPIVFDPATGQKTFPAGSGSEQGCTNTTLLEDGCVIEIGGQEGASPGSFRNATRWVKSWCPTSGWSRLADLLNPTGRWYPGLARLRDGDLLIMGGGTRPNAVRTDTCEVFDQATRTWRWTGTMGQAVEFPPAALLYTGQVLRTWGRPELYDPASGTWRPTGSFVAPNRGWPGHSDHSLVVLGDGRALVVGINTGQAGAGAPMVERYDPASGTWSARSSPSLRRMQTEVVYLPDGQVLVAGGDRQSQPTGEPSLYGIVKRTDLYDPDADRWRRVADLVHFREYHAVTVLVPDGRVLTTGGTNIKFRNPPLSADVEAFRPPYLFRGVRPSLSNLSTTTPRRGDTVTFDVFPATRLTDVVLIGTGAHTHWVEGGVPRRLSLAVQQSGSRASVALPSDRDLLPVGHYLLFGMVDDIPSVAAIVRVRL